MTTLVVTVAWRGRRHDLAIPADVPVGDLLRPLAAAVGADAPLCGLDDAVRGLARSGRPLALAPLSGVPLPPDRTLGGCGIGDGAVLVLLGA